MSKPKTIDELFEAYPSLHDPEPADEALDAAARWIADRMLERREHCPINEDGKHTDRPVNWFGRQAGGKQCTVCGESRPQ